MSISPKTLMRRFLSGSRRNGNGSGLAHEERTALFVASARSAKTVLFVDDEPSILKMRRLVFETLGYSVLTALSGQDALDALELHQVDAVVLDYLMPGMDGEETARRIRKLGSNVPIILSTGCLEVPEPLLEIVTAFVEKGTRPEVLIEVLEEQLSRCSMPDSSASLTPQILGWQASES